MHTFSKYSVQSFAYILSFFASTGQKPAKIDFIKANSYTYNLALVADIQKPTTISSKYPTALKYSSGDELSNIILYNEPYIGLAGKWISAGGEYQLTFACNGASSIKEGKGRDLKQSVHDPADPFRTTVTTYVKDYEVFLPAVLVLRHNGDTLKIVEISSATYPIGIVFHKGLIDAATKANTREVTGFADDIEAERYLSRAAKIVEQEAYAVILQKAANVKLHLLKNYLSAGEYTYTGIIRKKGREFNYDDFDTVTEHYKTALLSCKEPSVAHQNLFVDCIKDFEKLLGLNDGRSDANIEAILLYNLSNCYVRIGDIHKATFYLDKAALTIEKYGPSIISNARNYISTLQFRNSLKKEKYTSLER